MANSKRFNYRYGINYIITFCIRMAKQIKCRLLEEKIMFGYKLVKKETDEDLLKELIQMMEQTTKELIVEREALVQIGAVQKSITDRLDHIESFLDQMFGREEEEERTIN